MARRCDFVRGAVAIGSRRQTTWFQFEPVAATLTAVGGTIFFTLNAAAIALRPFTVVRTHFIYSVRSDQAAANEDQSGAVGIAVVSEEASTVGVTAVPTPSSNSASDLWLMHSYFGQSGSSVNSGRVGYNYAIDSKAMRKVDQGQDLVVVAEITPVSDGMILLIGGRMLVKLN